MTNYLLLIYPVLLIALTFAGSKLSPRGYYNDNMWNRNQTKLMQASACIGVILHHVTQLITTYGEIYRGPITIMSSMGILFTSIFFFSSGYGLIYNVRNRDNYLNGFICHRLPIILIPFFVANIICILVRIYYEHIPTTRANIIKCLSGYHLLNGNGWYIVEIFFLYIAFYILFRLIKNKDVALVMLILVTFVLITIGLKSGHDYTSVGDRWFKGEWWYNSTIVFVMGMLIARFKSPIVAFVKRHYMTMLILTSVMFIIAFIIEEHILKTHGYYRESIVIDGTNSALITLIAQSILCIISTWLVLLINMKLELGNTLLSKVGTISTEVFLIHGLFIKNIFDFKHTSDILIYAIVLVCGIVGAIACHFINIPIIKLLQNLKKDNSYLKECEADLFRQRRERNIRRAKIIIPAVLIAAALIYGCIYLYAELFGNSNDYNSELTTLTNAKVNDIINFGKIDTSYISPGREHMQWIVLKKEDNRIMLISLYGIDGSAYHGSHTDVSWQASDLRKELNDTLYNSLFNRYEKDIVIKNPDSGDYLSLLSVSEAYELFENDTSRQLNLTDVAVKKGTNVNTMSKVNYWDSKGYRSSWWWLRGDEGASLTAPIVTVDGTIEATEKYVNKPNGAVRPVIWIELPH